MSRRRLEFEVPMLVALCAAGVGAADAQRFVSPPSPPAAAAAPQRLWQVPEPARGAPATDGDSAYFLSTQHEVLAVDVETGRTRWQRKTYETGELLAGFAALVSGAQLVVADYNLLAFDRETGSLIWRFIPRQGYGPGIHLGTISDGAAIAGSPSGDVYAVDAEHGALRWSTSISDDGRTTVYAPAANGVFVAAAYTEFSAPTRGGMALLDAGTGRLLWKRSFPPPDDPLLSTNWAGGPVFAADVVAVASGDGNIRGFDLETGDIRWTIPRLTGRLPFPVAAAHDFRALAIDGDLLIASSSTGVVAAYDIATQAERWRYLASGLGSAAFRISASAGRVYVPFLNGVLVSLDAGTGRERWRTGTYQSGFLWPPVAAADRLLVAGAGEGLVALRDQW